jgi:hypothetical protein
MKISKIILVATMAAACATVPALAGGKGNCGGGRGAGGGSCPYGNVPGSGVCDGTGAGNSACDGTQQRLRKRDGSCTTGAQAPATAPGKGAKDGAGNQPRQPAPKP